MTKCWHSSGRTLRIQIAGARFHIPRTAPLSPPRAITTRRRATARRVMWCSGKTIKLLPRGGLVLPGWSARCRNTDLVNTQRQCRCHDSRERTRLVWIRARLATDNGVPKQLQMNRGAFRPFGVFWLKRRIMIPQPYKLWTWNVRSTFHLIKRLYVVAMVENLPEYVSDGSH